jgi:hypothetical protein
MSSERAVSVSAYPDGRARSRTIAGLIDVLDRADGVAPERRAQPRRASAHRPPGARFSAVRTVPLRTVRPAPMARPAPAAPPAARALPEPARAPVPGLAGLVRRAAMWGAGPRGERLAWRPRPAAAAPAVPAVQVPGRIRALARRAAMWGSGPRGEHLAWGGPAAAPVQRSVDPPVVLRELPSIPTIQPAAPSPAVALPPRGPASSAGSRGLPPIPRGAVAVLGVRPGGPPERSRANGWPAVYRRSPSATGPARTRGDPVPCPVRGSPAPARHSRSPGSVWSSFP